jgi:hypothetical protein
MVVSLFHRRSPQSATVPNQCAICLSSYEAGEEIVWSSNRRCDHAYHQGECSGGGSHRRLPFVCLSASSSGGPAVEFRCTCHGMNFVYGQPLLSRFCSTIHCLHIHLVLSRMLRLYLGILCSVARNILRKWDRQSLSVLPSKFLQLDHTYPIGILMTVNRSLAWMTHS